MATIRSRNDQPNASQVGRGRCVLGGGAAEPSTSQSGPGAPEITHQNGHTITLHMTPYTLRPRRKMLTPESTEQAFITLGQAVYEHCIAPQHLTRKILFFFDKYCISCCPAPLLQHFFLQHRRLSVVELYRKLDGLMPPAAACRISFCPAPSSSSSSSSSPPTRRRLPPVPRNAPRTLKESPELSNRSTGSNGPDSF